MSASALGPQLRAADRALCRLEGALSALPDSLPFADMLLAAEARESAALAGEPGTLADLVAATIGTGSASKSGCRSAVRCLEAMRRGLEHSGGPALPADALRRVHAVLAGATGPDGRDQRPDTAANPAFRELSRSFSAARQHPSRIPPLVLIGAAQAGIETGRTLPEASGRFGRLLVPLLLHRERGVAIGVSGYLASRAAAYGRATVSASSSTDVKEWLELFVEGIGESAASALERVARSARLHARHRQAIAARLGHSGARDALVLDHLVRRPVRTVSDIREITGTSYVAANKLAARFVELGILEEITGFRRNRVFCYSEFLRAFEASASPRLAGDSSAAAKAAAKGSPRPRPGTTRPLTPMQQAVPPEAPPASPVPRRRKSPMLHDHLL